MGEPQDSGRWAEDAAAAYLTGQGLRLRERNFRCRLGEIDLIMTDGAQLVFVEVRYRRSGRYGAGFETVTRAKRRRLMAAARAYLARHRGADAFCRFDVVSVAKPNYAAEFVWIRDAFGQDDQ